MKINLSPEWQDVLADEIAKPYFKELLSSLEEDCKQSLFF
jgi:uracil-DNA glycosylase